MKYRVPGQFRMEGGGHHVIVLDKNRIIINTGVAVDIRPNRFYAGRADKHGGKLGPMQKWALANHLKFSLRYPTL